MPTTPSSILALDIGEKRIGLALASTEAKLAGPLTTLVNDATFSGRLQEIIAQNNVDNLVVGLPRGMAGQDTAQSLYVQEFANGLKTLGLPIHLQDEAVTSKKAEAELRARGKAYTKEDIDALSATYILEDYLQGGAA